MNTVVLLGYGLIGTALARGLRENNFDVLVMDVSPPKDGTSFIEVDVTSEASLLNALAELNKKKLSVSAAVNTSYPRSPSYGKKLEDVTVENFNNNVSLQLGGSFNFMKNFGAYFQAQGGGSVVSFSSIYGISAPRFEIYDNATFTMPVEYAAVKSALLHLNGYFAKYFKGTNVRFNSISPGGVFDKHGDEFVKNYGKHSLSSRAGMLAPEDLIGSTVFLCSESSKYVNGQNIVVDDGWIL